MIKSFLACFEPTSTATGLAKSLHLEYWLGWEWANVMAVMQFHVFAGKIKPKGYILMNNSMRFLSVVSFGPALKVDNRKLRSEEQ